MVHQLATKVDRPVAFTLSATQYEKADKKKTDDVARARVFLAGFDPEHNASRRKKGASRSYLYNILKGANPERKGWRRASSAIPFDAVPLGTEETKDAMGNLNLGQIKKLMSLAVKNKKESERAKVEKANLKKKELSLEKKQARAKRRLTSSSDRKLKEASDRIALRQRDIVASEKKRKGENYFYTTKGLFKRDGGKLVRLLSFPKKVHYKKQELDSFPMIGKNVLDKEYKNALSRAIGIAKRTAR
jgi:hypothetical protein